MFIKFWGVYLVSLPRYNKKKHYQTSLELEQELMQEQKEEFEMKDKTTFRVFS